MSTPTNADRAESALQALEAFPMAENDLYTDAKDLITNLCHLVRRECFPNSFADGEFDAVAFVTAAAMMHDMELAEDEEE